MNLNKLAIIGRLTAKPEARSTASGKPYVSLAVAVTDYRIDAEGTAHAETDFFEVHAHGLNAGKALRMDPDSLVYVDGKFRSHRSTDGPLFWNLKAETIRRMDVTEAEPADEFNAD